MGYALHVADPANMHDAATDPHHGTEGQPAPLAPKWMPPLRPGVLYREADYIGNASNLAEPYDSIERAAKGDIGYATLDPPRATSGGVPFTNLRKGR